MYNAYRAESAVMRQPGGWWEVPPRRGDAMLDGARSRCYPQARGSISPGSLEFEEAKMHVGHSGCCAGFNGLRLQDRTPYICVAMASGSPRIRDPPIDA